MNKMKLKAFVETLAVISCCASFVITSQPYWGTSLTLIVFEGRVDCYFLPDIKRSKEISVEFRVTNTKTIWRSGTNVDVEFNVADPKGQRVIENNKASTGSYFFTASFDGDYKICVDNTLQSAGNKAVYLQIEVADSLKKMRRLLAHGKAEPTKDIVNSDGNSIMKDTNGVNENNPTNEVEDNDMAMFMEGDENMLESFGYKAAEIKMQLQEVRKNLRIASSIYNTVHQRSIRDYHLAVNSLQRVDFWSVVHLIILISTGLVQVYVMKSLFDDKINLVRKVFGNK